jgi:hypothetical protein
MECLENNTYLQVHNIHMAHKLFLEFESKFALALCNHFMESQGKNSGDRLTQDKRLVSSSSYARVATALII